MKINYKEQEHKEIAEVGDLIKFDDGVIVLVLRYGEIVLFKSSDRDDWFVLANDSKEDFKAGKYKIIAKAKDWEINIL